MAVRDEHIHLTATRAGVTVPALTRPIPNLHLTLIHLLCAAVDDSLARGAITELRPLTRAAVGLRDKEERPWP